jgi:hypothetical protein
VESEFREMTTDYIEKNDTLRALIAKLEDGQFSNDGGTLVQQLLASLRATAAKRNGKATGTITINIKVPMGKDGYALPVASIKCKAPDFAREETMIFVGEDGDLMSRPVEKQMPLTGIDGGIKVEVKLKDPAIAPSKGM